MRRRQLASRIATTAPIAAFHFRHSIAGAVEAFYRAVTGTAGWGEMLGGFVVPAPGFLPARSDGGRLVLHRWPHVAGQTAATAFLARGGIE